MQSYSRCFRTAARFIGRGWVQGRWRDSDGNVCLLQAVIDAIGIKQDAATLPMPVLAAIDAALMTTGTYCVSAEERLARRNIIQDQNADALSVLIWRWNDEEGRTRDEVVGALCRAADRLECQERYEQRAWMRNLMAHAIRPVTRRHAEDEEFALAD